MTIFIAIIILSWFVFIVYWAVSATSAKRTVRGRSWLVGALIRVALFLAAVVLLRDASIRALAAQVPVVNTNPVLAAIGALLTVAGVGFAVWARRHLGRNWGMPMSEKEGAELVTSGPYAYVRHPIYSGILLAILGSALAASIWWLVVFAFAFVYFFYSARTEEKRMTGEFPEAYPPYKKRTKMLIPFVV